MERYLEKEYIIKALKFYHITKIDNVLSLLEIVQKEKELHSLIVKFHHLLYIDKTDHYKKLKQYDDDKRNVKELNPLIILTGYIIHLQNMLRRNFDLYQMERQINTIHTILMKETVTFDDLQWSARLIRGNLIELGVLQYEVMHHTPPFLENYAAKKLIKIHIPKNSQLNDIEVQNSLEKIDEVLAKYYTDLPLNELIYYTESWLLSPELLEILPEDSNILKFQKRFEIVGLRENTTDFIKFIINNKERKNTILQAKVKVYLEKGRKLYLGTGILIRNQKINRRI